MGLDPVAPKDQMTNLLERAVSLERRGEVRGATELLKRGIATLPNPAPLYNKLALILLDQRRDFSEAEDLLQKAIDIDPEKTVYQKNLMRVVARAAEARERDGGKKSTGLLSKLFRK